MDSNLLKYLSNDQYRKNAHILFDKLLDAYGFLKKHKPSLGNFGEYILRDFLKKLLPDNVGITQGFVQGENGCLSPQCDIIIYKKTASGIIKSFGDIQIISYKNILSIIEVKTRIQRKTFESSLEAFKKLEEMGCSNNYIFIYNPISPQTLCSYFYPKNNDIESYNIGDYDIYDHGDQYYLPTAICDLKSNYFLRQDYIINERDEFGYVAYQLKDEVGEISCLQMFIGTIMNLCKSDTEEEEEVDISFNELNILYSHRLWQL